MSATGTSTVVVAAPMATAVTAHPEEPTLTTDRIVAIATEIANRNPHAIRGAKRLANAMHEDGTDHLLMEESREQHAIRRSPNQVEAVMAGMEKRRANYADV